MRRITPRHSPSFAKASEGEQGTVTSSTMCLCKSSIFFPLASSSSAALPNTLCFLHASQRHMGMTLAQNRWREMDQSRAPSSHLPNLPSLMCAGDQFTASAFFSKFSFIFVTETNHDEVA